MRKIALLLVCLSAVACGAPQKAKETPDQVAEDICCCKWTPQVSEDGKAQFATENRLECSGKQGDCVDESQCTAAPADGGDSGPAVIE